MTSIYTISSPVGPLKITAEEDAILAVDFTPELASSDRDLSPVVLQCANELKEYFDGRRKIFEVPLKLEGTDFQKAVWQELLKIPYGKTISYAQLSVKLGDLKAIRAVGTANGKNKIPVIIPCHRVIGSDGNLTGYSGGLDKKKWLLQHEGAIPVNQLTLHL
ncbi:MAG: methylated-DNA--[protein]-cysteine S-methyltransferase [Candidatus Cyclobacteriaceae bacterium M2_1C_046]